jgi:hypothetical protein
VAFVRQSRNCGESNLIRVDFSASVSLLIPVLAPNSRTFVQYNSVYYFVFVMPV